MYIKVANILLDGRYGGPQNRVLQVAEKLKNHGIETVVIIPDKDSEIFYSKLISKNIKVKRLKLHRLTKDKTHLLGWFFFFVPEVIRLYSYLKKENISLVHCNAPWQIKGVIAGKMAKIKLIWHINDSEMPKIIKTIFNLVARLSDGFILTGERVRDFYFNTDWINNIQHTLIQAPVNCSRFNPENVNRDKTIGHHNAITITTVGNINPTKRIEDFIEIANQLRQKYDNLFFCVVGQQFDSQKKYYKKLIHLVEKYNITNLLFYGQSDNVESILKATDIFVCTSESESGPMCVWEAMSMGKAIVSTDVGDVRRYLQNGDNGFIVPANDVSALAENVAYLIENENVRKRFGEKVRNIAVKELDISKCVEKHKKFYFEVLDQWEST